MDKNIIFHNSSAKLKMCNTKIKSIISKHSSSKDRRAITGLPLASLKLLTEDLIFVESSSCQLIPQTHKNEITEMTIRDVAAVLYIPNWSPVFVGESSLASHHTGNVSNFLTSIHPFCRYGQPASQLQYLHNKNAVITRPMMRLYVYAKWIRQLLWVNLCVCLHNNCHGGDCSDKVLDFLGSSVLMVLLVW